MVADQSQPSQSSWSQHRDQLTKRVAGLAEAGVLEASAYQDFLASTPLPHRDQAHGMTNEAMQQVQIEFNDKLLQCIDGQSKDEGSLVISGMNDGQYIPETESEMYSDQGPSSDDEVVSIRSRSSLGSDKTTLNASKTERPSHFFEDTGILEFHIPPGSTQVLMDQDMAGLNIPDVTSEMLPNGSNISQDASVVKSDVTSLSTQSPPAMTVSQSPITKPVTSRLQWRHNSHNLQWIQVTRAQIMFSLETLGVSHDEFLGTGESGTGVWEVYCLTQYWNFQVRRTTQHWGIPARPSNMHNSGTLVTSADQ